MALTTLIGIDVGTTATKAILVDEKGNRLDAFSRAHATTRPASGHAEQDPRDWMAGVLAALHQFAASHDLGGLAGIGICSQVNTHVFVDATGEPLLPAIIWQDTRSAPAAAALDALVTAEQKLEWFGGPVPIDASHALSRMEHVRRTQPDIYEQTRYVLLPKDYCVLQLTGAVGSDPISAVGLVDRNGYVAPLLDLVPEAARRLPPLHGFTHVAGRVRDGLPCAGAPVVVGAMDAWGGMFGVGVARDGDAIYQSGTSEIPGIVSSTVNPTPGVILFPPYEGIVPSSAVPLFLPHLQGERAPIWDASSRGAFARLDNRAGAPEMVRGVMEGVAFSVRWAFEALQRSAGRSLQIANIGGGGSRSDVWCQIRADALGFTLNRAAAPESAAIGAAIIAGAGSGVMPSIAEAATELVQFDRRFEPNAALRGYYDDKFDRYRELYEALRPLNA